MKKYKSSDLTHKRAELLKEAKANGVIIEKRNTNGDIDLEFLLILKPTSREEFSSAYPGKIHECKDPQCKECSYDY